jgi:hypothetical protein
VQEIVERRDFSFLQGDAHGLVRGSGAALQSFLGKMAQVIRRIVHIYHSVVKAINLCFETMSWFSRSGIGIFIWHRCAAAAQGRHVAGWPLWRRRYQVVTMPAVTCIANATTFIN